MKARGLQAFAEAALEEDQSILKFDKNDVEQEILVDRASEESDDSLMSLGLGLGIKVPTYLANKYRLRSAAVCRPQVRCLLRTYRFLLIIKSIAWHSWKSPIRTSMVMQMLMTVSQQTEPFG